MLTDLLVGLFELAARLPPWYVRVDVLLVPVFVAAHVWFERGRRRWRGW